MCVLFLQGPVRVWLDFHPLLLLKQGGGVNQWEQRIFFPQVQPARWLLNLVAPCAFWLLTGSDLQMLGVAIIISSSLAVWSGLIQTSGHCFVEIGLDGWLDISLTAPTTRAPLSGANKWCLWLKGIWTFLCDVTFSFSGATGKHLVQVW